MSRNNQQISATCPAFSIAMRHSELLLWLYRGNICWTNGTVEQLELVNAGLIKINHFTLMPAGVKDSDVTLTGKGNEYAKEFWKARLPRADTLPQHPCYADGEYDHDWEFQDESFDHEYGTETCGYWECLNCNLIDAD